LGRHGTEALLAAYFAAQPPEPFAAVEAAQFVRFLQARLPLPVPHLDEVLAFEHALLRATVHGLSADVRWSVDPARLLQALDEGRLPAALPRVDSVMRVCAA
jgi:hypothetical protein